MSTRTCLIVDVNGSKKQIKINKNATTLAQLKQIIISKFTKVSFGTDFDIKTTRFNEEIEIDGDDIEDFENGTKLVIAKNKPNTKTSQTNKTNAIDLTADSPEPKPEKLNSVDSDHISFNSINTDFVLNTNENYNNTMNTNNNGSNQAHFMKLSAKSGKKEQYSPNEMVIFFIPSMAEQRMYIDRIGIIDSQINQTEYTIKDNDLIYTVPWSLILKYGSDNSENTNEENGSVENSENTNVSIATVQSIENIFKCVCDKQMKPLMAKDAYNDKQYRCVGNGCHKEISELEIVYHCDNVSFHGQTYDLCEICMSEDTNAIQSRNAFAGTPPARITQQSVSNNLILPTLNMTNAYMPPLFATAAAINSAQMYGEQSQSQSIPLPLPPLNLRKDKRKISQTEITKAAYSGRGFKAKGAWQQWEIDFVVKCDKEYKNSNITKTQKAIEISHRLSEHTKTVRKGNEPRAPWRTSLAVRQCLLKCKKKTKKRKKGKKKRDSNEPLTKKRRS